MWLKITESLSTIDSQVIHHARTSAKTHHNLPGLHPPRDIPGNLTKTRGFVYTYDAAGQMLTRKYSDGDTSTYTYDADGRTATMAADGKTTTYSWDHDTQGSPVDVTNSTGTLYQRWAYDSFGTRVLNTTTSGAPASTPSYTGARYETSTGNLDSPASTTPPPAASRGPTRPPGTCRHRTSPRTPTPTTCPACSPTPAV